LIIAGITSRRNNIFSANCAAPGYKKSQLDDPFAASFFHHDAAGDSYFPAGVGGTWACPHRQPGLAILIG
jgi:hypothetical protein